MSDTRKLMEVQDALDDATGDLEEAMETISDLLHQATISSDFTACLKDAVAHTSNAIWVLKDAENEAEEILGGEIWAS